MHLGETVCEDGGSSKTVHRRLQVGAAAGGRAGAAAGRRTGAAAWRRAGAAAGRRAEAAAGGRAGAAAGGRTGAAAGRRAGAAAGRRVEGITWDKKLKKQPKGKVLEVCILPARVGNTCTDRDRRSYV